jgi:hypothetical protein
MRIITDFYSVESLPLDPCQIPLMKKAIHGCREWLGTNEGQSRVAIFENLTCDSQGATPKVDFRVIHFSVSHRRSKSSNPSQPA